MTQIPAPAATFRNGTPARNTANTAPVTVAPEGGLAEAVQHAAEAAPRTWTRLDRTAYLALSSDERKAYTAWSKTQGGGMRGANASARAQRAPTATGSRAAALATAASIASGFEALRAELRLWSDRPEVPGVLEAVAEAADWFKDVEESLRAVPAEYTPPPPPPIAVGDKVRFTAKGLARWESLFETTEGLTFEVARVGAGAAPVYVIKAIADGSAVSLAVSLVDIVRL